MSHFAEHLVARAAGGSADLFTVLRPRPVSRYETPASSGFEEVPNFKAPEVLDSLGAGTPTSDPGMPAPPNPNAREGILSASPPGGSPLPAPLIEDFPSTGETAGPKGMRGSFQERGYGRIPEPVLSGDKVCAENQPPEARTLLKSEEKNIGNGHSPKSPEPYETTVATVVSRPAAGPIQAAPVKVTDTLVQPAGSPFGAGSLNAKETPAPVISIGRIDVQFLPQESRTPQPASKPQRTRGFDAYGRARRGEPR